MRAGVGGTVISPINNAGFYGYMNGTFYQGPPYGINARGGGPMPLGWDSRTRILGGFV